MPEISLFNFAHCLPPFLISVLSHITVRFIFLRCYNVGHSRLKALLVWFLGAILCTSSPLLTSYFRASSRMFCTFLGIIHGSYPGQISPFLSEGIDSSELPLCSVSLWNFVMNNTSWFINVIIVIMCTETFLSPWPELFHENPHSSPVW